MHILLTLFLILVFIGFIKNLYGFYRDYFFRNIKRDYVFFYMLQTILLVFVLWKFFQTSFVPNQNKSRYEKVTLKEKENILGVEWGKGTVVTPASKEMRREKISYVLAIEKVLFQGIFVTELKIQSFVPAIDTIDKIEIVLAEDSVISKFPCSKDARVEILADGMLRYCELSEDITLQNIKLKKGTIVQLINANNGAHPTFKMVSVGEYDTKESYEPIWETSNNRLDKDTVVSGIQCLKGSSLKVLDNGKLVRCSKIGAMELDGFNVREGCTVSNINPLQGKIKNLIDVWDIDCLGINIGKTTFSVMTFRYSLLDNKVMNMRASISEKKEHTLKDLLKGVSHDTH